MNINGRKHINDIVKDNSAVILAVIILIFLLFYASLNTLAQYFEKQSIEEKNIKIQNEKIEKIKNSKPPLLCNQSYIDSDDYDIVSINGNIVIETIFSIGTPKEAIDFSKCSIYDKLTTSIKKPIPVSMEEKVLEELKNLRVRNELLVTDNNSNKTKIDALEKMIVEKNNEIKQVVAIVDEKQKNINELLEYSIKYKEVKELLSIALSGQSDKLNAVMTRILNGSVKNDDDFKISESEKQKIEHAKKVAENKSLIDLELQTDNTKNLVTQIKLRAYIMKELTNKISKRNAKDIEKFEIPTKEILENIQLSDTQIKKADNVLNSYNKTIAVMIDVLSKTRNADKNLVNQNINALLTGKYE